MVHTTSNGMLVGIILLIVFSVLAIIGTVVFKHRQAVGTRSAGSSRDAAAARFDNPLAASVQVKEMSEA